MSKRGRAWIKTNNLKAMTACWVRIVECHLEVKAPWLNAIEPKWPHGEKAIVEPDRLLTARQVQDRVCSHYHCELQPPLVQLTNKKVA